jgi:hypothetical protein
LRAQVNILLKIKIHPKLQDFFVLLSDNTYTYKNNHQVSYHEFKFSATELNFLQLSIKLCLLNLKHRIFTGNVCLEVVVIGYA